MRWLSPNQPVLAIMAGIVAACQTAAAPGPVRSVEELDRRLHAARGGEVIVLQKGDYRNVRLSGVTPQPIPAFSKPVILKAAAPGVRFIGSTRIADLKNVTFEGIHFDFPDASRERDVVVLVERSSDVKFADVRVTGTVRDGSYFGKGIDVRFSKNIEISGAEVSGAHRGILLGQIDGMIVRRNRLHDLGSDGINMTAASDVVIEQNRIWNFNPAGTDHSDGIQGFSGGQTRGLSNILISNNLIIGGVAQGGGQRTQGIFIRSEKAKDGIRHANIRILDNVITNPNFHGITLQNVDGAEVARNKILWARDAQHDPKARWAWVMVKDATSAVVEDNLIPKLLQKQSGDWRRNREAMVTSQVVDREVADWDRRVALAR